VGIGTNPDGTWVACAVPAYLFRDSHNCRELRSRRGVRGYGAVEQAGGAYACVRPLPYPLGRVSGVLHIPTRLAFRPPAVRPLSTLLVSAIGQTIGATIGLLALSRRRGLTEARRPELIRSARERPWAIENPTRRPKRHCGEAAYGADQDQPEPTSLPRLMSTSLRAMRPQAGLGNQAYHPSRRHYVTPSLPPLANEFGRYPSILRS
jgi:hypothetical protein